MMLILLGRLLAVGRPAGEELSDDFVGVLLEEGELERVKVVGRAVESDPREAKEG